MQRHTQRTLSMALALGLDLLGEPPTPLHPVVGMGRYLSGARDKVSATSSKGQLLEGAGWWALGAASCYGAGAALSGLPWYAQGAALKPLLARRALFRAVEQVRDALQAGNLPEARRLLGYHLVSRDTSTLSASEVAGAAIESLGENLSDSVVAPLLAYALGGLPLATLYRYVNTADAMWGYRTPELEYAGKVAARADDLLNVYPARLSALCILAATGGRGWRVWRTQHAATPSPNAGHPMSALAGALGVQLDKRGVYALNPAGRKVQVSDIDVAIKVARRGLNIAVVACMAAAFGAG